MTLLQLSSPLRPIIASLFVAAAIFASSSRVRANEVVTDGPETIIVTGHGRDLETLSAAGSVDRLEPDDLDAAGIFDLRELGTRVPGLVVSTNSALVQPYLRGVGSDLLSAGLESSVAVVVDDVYRPRSAGALIDLFDIDRVEVLRGPQGLQYGRNATGGVLQVRTARPKLQNGVEADATYGSYELARLRYALNLAVPSGKSAVRIAGMHKQQDGYMRNVLQRESLEGEDLNALRLQGVYHANDQLSLLAGADYSRDEGTRGLAPRLAPPFSGSPALGLGGSLPDDRLRVRLDRAPQATNEQFGGRFVLEYAAESFSVESISAFRSNELQERLDLDGTEVSFITNDVEEESQSATQEIRIGSTREGQFDWMAGGFYQNERARQDLNPRFPVAAIDDRIHARVATHAFALFADFGLRLPANLRLAAGARYSREYRELELEERFNGPLVADFSSDADWDGWSPQLSLEWSPRAGLSSYAKFARGFKGGGFNTTAAQNLPVRPESLWSFEVGSRATLLDERLRLEGAVFYYDYRDMQLHILSPSSSLLFPIVENAGEATLYGLETGFDLGLPGEIRLDGQFVWLEAEFDHLRAVDVNQPAASPDQSGNRLPRAPRFAFALGGEIEIDLARFGRLTPRVEYRHQSATHFDVFEDDATRQAGYGLVNAQLSLDVLEDRFGIVLHGYNLADERYATSFFRIDGQFGNVSFLGSPRTFGLTFRARL